MIRLRPYKESMLNIILFGLKTKWLHQWCADKFIYPLTKSSLIYYYHNYEKEDNGWIMTALNEEEYLLAIFNEKG